LRSTREALHAWGDTTSLGRLRVLVVDADEIRAQLVGLSLRRVHRYDTALEPDPTRALARLGAEAFDAALVSWSLEPIQGPDVCSAARASGFDGTLVLIGGRARDEDVVQALVFAGADDFVVEPTSATVIAARLFAAARRRRRATTRPGAFVLRSAESAELCLEDRSVRLSPVECRILEALMSSEAPVPSERLAPRGGAPPTPRLGALRVHVTHLRAKLGPDAWRIETVPGGYRFRRERV
jgi:DNA-binding response OmpR family regulator